MTPMLVQVGLTNTLTHPSIVYPRADPIRLLMGVIKQSILIPMFVYKAVLWRTENVHQPKTCLFDDLKFL